eukprot:1196905-Pyramimonas_sp.AAC.1
MWSNDGALYGTLLGALAGTSVSRAFACTEAAYEAWLGCDDSVNPNWRSIGVMDSRTMCFWKNQEYRPPPQTTWESKTWPSPRTCKAKQAKKTTIGVLSSHVSCVIFRRAFLVAVDMSL